jgi:hypothetical protein
MAKKRSMKPAEPTRRPAAGRAADVLPQGYAEFLDGLKARIRTAQVRATLAISRELVALYWELGRPVVERQEAEG